jgi:hypothetical protein
MTWNKNHPARSHAFLSRLHDGDLQPSERAHFEAHRAHCASCRTAAAEYERALSLFRSARSSPPPADMANRVLRKLQTYPSSRRTPFGNLFAIDWRWASAFAAALLVLLIGAPFALKQQDKATVRPEGPISVALQDRERGAASAPAPPASFEEARRAPASAPAREAPQALRKQNAPAPPRRDEKQGADSLQNRYLVDGVEVAEAKPAAPQAKLESEAAAPSKSQANAQGETRAYAQAPPASNRQAGAAIVMQNQAGDRDRAAQANRANENAATPVAAAANQVQVQERSGGEGGRDAVLVSGNSPVLDRPTRIVVQVLDALGSAPDLVGRPEEPDLTALRGRSFVLVVAASGHVKDVRENADKKSADADLKRRDAQIAKEKDAAADPLKRLRFKVGERPRRLLVRVE